MAEASKVEKRVVAHIPDPKILRKEIVCGVCKKQYQSPKTLHCLHSFCLSCLQSVSATETTVTKIRCPQCTKETWVQSNNCDELLDAYHINRQMKLYDFLRKVHGQIETNCEKCANKSVKAQSFCRDCGKFICELCITIHTSWSEFESHTVLSLDQLKQSYERYIPEKVEPLRCPIHAKECTVYCETCEEQICHECIVKGHRDHQYLLISDAAKNHQVRMAQKLESIQSIPKQVDSAITSVERICARFSAKGREITGQIDDEYDEMQALLDIRHTSLLEEVDHLVSTKLGLLTEQKKGFENIRAKTASCIEFTEHTMTSGHISEYFLLEHQIAARISEVKKDFSGTDLTPVEVPEAHFSLEPHIKKSLPTSGSVSEGSMLYAGTKDSRLYDVNELATFYIALSSIYYKSRVNPSDELKAEIQSFRDGSICPAMVAVSSSGFAKLQCSFSERGRYAVIVKVAGHEIGGSPCEFFVRPPSTQFQAPIRVLNKLSSSKGITVNARHHIIVSEENRHSVSVYGKKSKRILSFGELGEAEGQFNQPIGVCTDYEGQIYVADSKNNRVQKFDTDGNFLAAFTGEDSSCGALKSPTGVKLDRAGRLVVVDRGNSRIAVLTSELEFVSMFEAPRTGLGQLSDPWDVAFDKYGFVYVTDMNQHCIQIYNPDGEFRGRIGSSGTQKGHFSRPSGIAIDQFGMIYVCEFGNHRVSIFHTSSEFVDCFSTGLSMVNPCGIAIDADGYVYVSSTEIVQVF